MNGKQIGLSVILVGFLALSAEVLYQYGYIGLFQAEFANLATIAAFVDLTIALSLIVVWLWYDASERGVSFLPYFLLTLTLGSVGPLLYLIRRAKGEAAHPTAIAPQRA